MEFSYHPINPFQDDGLSKEDRAFIDGMRNARKKRSIRMTNKCCGTCKYNGYDRENKSFICDNPDGEYFGCDTGYSDKCPDWEEKE